MIKIHMSKEDILQKMQDILSADFEIEKDAIIPDAKLYDDLELDSIDAIDLLVKIKEFLPGKINPDSFKKAVTVQDVVDVLYSMAQKT
jgi:acyl carrier protein